MQMKTVTTAKFWSTDQYSQNDTENHRLRLIHSDMETNYTSPETGSFLFGSEKIAARVGCEFFRSASGSNLPASLLGGAVAARKFEPMLLESRNAQVTCAVSKIHRDIRYANRRALDLASRWPRVYLRPSDDGERPLARRRDRMSKSRRDCANNDRPPDSVRGK